MPITAKVYQNVAGFQSKLRVISGNIAITGATGAVGTQTMGRGASVAKTSTGLYTITVAGSGALQIVSAEVSATVDADDGYVTKVRAISSTARTVTFKTATEAAPGVPAHPAAGTLLQFTIIVNDAPIGQQ